MSKSLPVKVLVIGLLLLTVLTGCAKKVDSTPSATTTTIAKATSTDTTKPVTVTAWYTFAGTNEANFKKAIERFNSSQDKYQVVGVSQSWNEINEKVMSSLKAGNYPDIIAGEAATISNYVKEDLVVDFMPYILDSETGIADFDDYLPAVVEECKQWDGQMYMFPISRTGEVYYYNKTYFDEHGLTVPTTWEELYETNKKIHELTGKQTIGFDYIDDSYIDMVIQNGGTYLDDVNKKAGFLTQESIDAVSFLKKMKDEGMLRLKGEDKSLFMPFANELVYGFIGTSATYKSVLSSVEDAFEIGYAPIPQGGEKEYVTMWGVSMSVFKSTPERQQGAFQFLKSFTDAEMNAEWAIGYNALPVRQSAIDSAKYQEFLQNGNPVVNVLVAQSDRYGYQKAVSGSYEANNAITIALEEILIGSETIEKGLQEAQKEADAALNR